MCACPSVQKALTPYLTARFSGVCKEAYKKWSALIPRDVLGRLEHRRKGVFGRLEYLRNHTKRDYYNWYGSDDEVYFRATVIDSFMAFFDKYKEGGVVALILVKTAGFPQWWTCDLRGMIGDYGYYPDFNVLYLPTPENRKPWEVLLFLEELTQPLSGINFATECAKFYEHVAGINPYHRKEKEIREGHECRVDLDNLVTYGARAGEFTRLIEDRKEIKEIKRAIGLNAWREHLNIENNRWWDKSNGLIKAYLMARACDVVRFSQEVADVTFPQPDVNGATAKEVTEFVASLVEMIRQMEKYREWPNYLPKLVVPEHLDLRVLSAAEKHVVLEACMKELRASDVQG
jgi:hypothetical protein